MTTPTFPPDFGPRLRAAMVLHDIKHWQLAKRMDVSRGLVSQLCSGVKTPSGPVASARARSAMVPTPGLRLVHAFSLSTVLMSTCASLASSRTVMPASARAARMRVAIPRAIV